MPKFRRGILTWSPSRNINNISDKNNMGNNDQLLLDIPSDYNKGQGTNSNSNTKSDSNGNANNNVQEEVVEEVQRMFSFLQESHKQYYDPSSFAIAYKGKASRLDYGEEIAF